MPLQNRVDPYGNLLAVADRGGWMGNRGCLHDTHRSVVRRSARDAWVLCRLQWKGIRRAIMSPGRYTELFFLDEATALSAGHRPCNDCQSERLGAFKEAWASGVDETLGKLPTVARIDAVLKQERAVVAGSRQPVPYQLGGLPDGVMVQVPDGDNGVHLWWRGKLHRWTPGGYAEARRGDLAATVLLLTPLATTKAIAAGYLPEVHASVGDVR